MDWTDPFPVVLLLALTLTLLLKWAGFWSSSSRALPPGPRPFPLIGNLHIFDLKRLHRTMLKLSKEYGSIFSIQMGVRKMVVLTGYETVKEALVNQADAFAERPYIAIFDEFARNFGEIVEECGSLIKALESHGGNPFEGTTIMNAAVSNIIVSILFGKQFEYDDARFLRLLKLVSENIRLGGSPSVLLYNMFPAFGFLLDSCKTVLKNRDEVFAFINDTFVKHLKDLDENDQRNFIDSFLIRQQEEKKSTSTGFFHQENLRALVSDLFGAGTETTSSTLRWGILLMMKYPDIQSEYFCGSGSLSALFGA
ncbi:cytochrome P450 2K6-like [Varanus komodoensis]|uniref:cytochrome P450 2K6-like n=1 Tax=Varanus komodoensis TaxID=61221 RepID=UPI001CF76F23|nr:cytochrome P450 2K6-like [Varanus komodoensis]